jgi:hypothetical protein
MNTLAYLSSQKSQTKSRKPKTLFYGRKTMKKKFITGVSGRGKFLKDWSRQQPGYHDRTIMMKKCGKKCFLGPNKSFPICGRNTCKRNRKGIYSAYIRAEEYKTIKNKDKYRRISAKARRMLHKNKFLHIK